MAGRRGDVAHTCSVSGWEGGGEARTTRLLPHLEPPEAVSDALGFVEELVALALREECILYRCVSERRRGERPAGSDAFLGVKSRRRMPITHDTFDGRQRSGTMPAGCGAAAVGQTWTRPCSPSPHPPHAPMKKHVWTKKSAVAIASLCASS